MPLFGFSFILLCLGVIGWGVVALWQTLAWTLSGEAGGVLYRGYGSKGLRLRRTVELESVVGHVALITRLNLPLHSALRAAGKGEIGRVGQSLTYMAYLLSRGWPVSEALGAADKGCPTQLVSILRQGEQSGQLPQAVADVKRMLAVATRTRRQQTANTGFAGAYATLMLLVITFIMFWVMVLIIPRGMNIFMDFEVDLPPITVALRTMCGWVAVRSGWPLLLPALGLILLTVLGLWLRGNRKAGWVTRIVGTLRWAFPISRTIDYGLGMATTIRTIALGLRGGAALDRSVVLTSAVAVTNHLRVRLTGFVEEVHAGIAPHQAAQNARLGDVFVSALKMIERGEDAERVLAHAADYYEANALRWWHAVSAISGPLVTLLFAGIVGFIALALFIPLVTLMNAVADSII